MCVCRFVCVCRKRVRAAEVDLLFARTSLSLPPSSFLLAVEKDYVQYVEAFKSDTRGGGGEVNYSSKFEIERKKSDSSIN